MSEMRNDEEFWLNTYTMNQAYRKIIHMSNNFNEFNKDTKRDYEYICKKLGINKDDDVFELGCGIGRLLAPISLKCKSIHGADVSGNILSLAEPYFGNFKDVGKVALINMPNKYTVPLRDNMFDKAYSFIVLQHMNKYVAYAVILEMHRLLKFGGKMLIQLPNLRKQKAEFFEHVGYWTSITVPTARMYYYLKEELEIYFKEMMKWSNVEIWEEGVDIWIRATK